MSEGTVRFTVKRFVLLRLCERALPAVDREGTHANFLVEVAPGQLSVTGSDLELTISETTISVDTSDTGSLLLPARKLRAMLAEAPEGDITIEASGAKATVSAASVSWDLRLSDPADYTPPPAIAELEAQPVSREKLLSSIKTVRHAISRDGGRPPLMMVDISDSRMTASDGSRLQRVMLDFPVDMKIPAAAVDHLLRVLGSSEAAQISVAEKDNYLVFRAGRVTFIAKKTQARFPDIERLLLKPALANEHLLSVNRGLLLEAIRRVRINADAETSAVALRLTRDKITVTSRDKDGNGAEQAVEAWWKGDEGRLLVVNHIFLTEMLGVWPAESCRFWLGGDSARKKLIMLSDQQDGTPATQIGIINQLHAALLGYA